MSALVIHPVTRRVQRAAVARWHSHNRRSTAGERLALGGSVAGELVAVIVLGSPAVELDDGTTWEVARLACGPIAPRYTASRLLGAAGRVMDAAGVTRQVSYTRADERGSCYLAAGWRPTAWVIGREHTTGNRALRCLPGLYDAGTEIVDRVRWERGPRAAPPLALTWTPGGWVLAPATTPGEPERP